MDKGLPLLDAARTPETGRQPAQKWTRKASVAAAALLAAVVLVLGLRVTVGEARQRWGGSDAEVGDVVDITRFVRAGQPHVAREATRVTDPSILPGVTSYAGFATVEEEKKNHLFWWFLEPTDVAKETKYPVVIWLQGGPGASSLFGMFSELGPFRLNEDLSVQPRDVHWGRTHGLLFIDNPVGTGFSFSETGALCNSSKGEGDAASQLHELLEQFYQVFPELLEHDLYIAAESYGGKWAPGFGYKVMREREAGRSKIPLRGVSVGNGWTDPVNQLGGYPDLLHTLSLITSTERKRVQEYCDAAVGHVKRGEFGAAFLIWDEMLNGDLFGYPNYFYNVTGLTDYFNYLNTEEPAYEEYFSDFVQLPRVRRAIHVGDRPFGAESKSVEVALRDDFMVSVREEVEALLAGGYKVLIYNGQLDIIINPALTRRYLDELRWPGRAQHMSEPQHVWRMAPGGKRVFGYIKQAAGLTTAVVRDAGHMVPSDQPEAALDLVSRWIQGLAYN